MKRILIVVLAVLVALTVLGCGKGKEEGKAEKAKGETITAKMLQEMSTTVVSTFSGHTNKAKLSMKADKMRMESDAAAGSYTIVRRDLKKMWMVMPSTKSYMEMAEAKEDVPVPEEKVKGEVSRKVVGSETVDGHPCTKYEVTAKDRREDRNLLSVVGDRHQFPHKGSRIGRKLECRIQRYQDRFPAGQPVRVARGVPEDVHADNAARCGQEVTLYQEKPGTIIKKGFKEPLLEFPS